MVLSQTNVSSNVGKSTPTTNTDNYGKTEGTAVVERASTGQKEYYSGGKLVKVVSESGSVAEPKVYVSSSKGAGDVGFVKGARESVGEQYSKNQTTPSEAFKPSFESLATGTNLQTPAGLMKQGYDTGKQSVYVANQSQVLQQAQQSLATRQAQAIQQRQAEPKPSFESLATGASVTTPSVQNIQMVGDMGYTDTLKQQSVQAKGVTEKQVQVMQQERLASQITSEQQQKQKESFSSKASALGGELKRTIENIGESVGAFGYGITVKAPAYLIEGRYKEAKESIINPKAIEGAIIVGTTAAGGGLFGKALQKGTQVIFTGYSGYAGVKSIVQPTKENVAQALLLSTPFEKLKIFPKTEIKGEPKITYKETKTINVEGQISEIPSSSFKQKQPVKIQYELKETGLLGSGKTTKVIEKFYPDKIVKTEKSEFLGRDITKVTNQGLADIKATEKVFIDKELARTDVVKGTDYLKDVKTIELLGTQSGLQSIKKEQVMEGTLGIKEGKVVELQPKTVLKQSNIAIASQSQLGKVGGEVMRTDIVSESSFLKTDKVGAQVVETRGQTVFTKDVKLAKELETGFKSEKRNVDISLGDVRKSLPEVETVLLSKQEGFKLIERETGKETGITQLISETKRNPKLKSELILKYDISGKITKVSEREKKVFDVIGKEERPGEVNINYNNLRQDITSKSKELIKGVGDDLRNAQAQITELLPKREATTRSFVEVEKLNIPSSRVNYVEPKINQEIINQNVFLSTRKSISSKESVYEEIQITPTKSKFEIVSENKLTSDVRKVIDTKKDMMQVSKPKSMSSYSTKSFNEQIISSRQEVLQQQESVSQQKQLQELKEERLIDKFKFERPRFGIPEIKTPTIVNMKLGSVWKESPRQKEGFVVEIGKKGKTKIYEKKSFGSIYEAENFLRGELKGTLAASGTIKTTSGQSVMVNLGEEFTPSKREAGRVVQKREFRLSSGGEKAQIRGFRI